MKHEFTFKSYCPFYEKEREGLKNNTVRRIDLNDNRFLELIAWNMIGYNPGEISIKIILQSREDIFFIREIRDITIYNDTMIITWKHKGDKK